MKDYPPETFQFGTELEICDASKPKIAPILPDWAGRVEYAEKEIANELPPYRGVACDPAGIDPPVGFEINTKPTLTWEDQVKLILDIVKWIKEQGEPANASFTSPLHCHVHVPYLTDRKSVV